MWVLRQLSPPLHTYTTGGIIWWLRCLSLAMDGGLSYLAGIKQEQLLFSKLLQCWVLCCTCHTSSHGILQQPHEVGGLLLGMLYGLGN